MSNYNYSCFNGGWLNGSNCSGENISWNRGRLRIRSCTLNTNKTASIWSNVNIRCLNSNTGAWSTVATTTLTDNGSFYGYCTNVSSYFTLSNFTTACLGLQINGSSGVVRIGPVYLELSS